MFKKVLCFICGLMILAFTGTARAEEDWNFKVSLQKHRIVLHPGSDKGVFDQANITTIPPLMKNGSVFIPLKLINDLKLGEVKWNAQGKYTDIEVPERNIHVRYRIGKPFVYLVDGEGEEFNQSPIPTPFIKTGITYIPVKSFASALGKNISFVKNELVITWGDVIITKRDIPEKTEAEEVTVKVIYEEGMDRPLIMNSHGGGTFSGETSEKDSKFSLVIDSNKFKGVSEKLSLRPGCNLFYLWIQKGGLSIEERFFIRREVPNPEAVPLDYEKVSFSGKLPEETFEIIEPKNGYEKLSAPGKIKFDSRLKQESFGNNVLTVKVSKLMDYEYQEIKRIAVPVQDRQFSTEIDIEEPGEYLLEIISPGFYPATDGSLTGEKWAEIMIEVGSQRGNTQGNLINSGLFAEYQGWVYYSAWWGGEGKLYKKKPDGSNKTKVIDDIWIKDINIINDQIFYNSSGNLTRCSLDGKNKVVLDTQTNYVSVADDWIYYTRGDHYQGYIWRMKTDGTEKQKIGQDLVGQIQVDDGNTYYGLFGKYFKIGMDGSSKTKLFPEANIWHLIVAKDWFYFSNPDGIYKVSKDGKQRQKIVGDASYYFNLSGEWIYYCSSSKPSMTMYRVKTDGSAQEQLVGNTKIEKIFLIDNIVYYEDLYTNSFQRISMNSANLN